MNKNNMIEIKVNLETKDFWKSYFSQYFSFNNILFNFLSFTIFGLAVSILFLRNSFELPHVIDVLICAFFFTLFTSFIWTWLSVKNAKNIGGQKCKYIFTDDKVEIFAESFSSAIDWKYFQRIKETGKYFILFMINGQQLTLPKMYFQQEELIDFKTLVRAKLGNEAYLKKTKGNLGLK